MEIVVIYILCCLASWFILVDAWRDDSDLDWPSALLFACVSIVGPVSLLIAACIWIMDKAFKPTRNNKGTVLWRKK